MKTAIAFFLVSIAMGSLTYASCEDGNSIAEQAVKSMIQKKFPLVNINQCRVSTDARSILLISTGEIWTVNFSCSSGLSSKFTVTLLEIEDAVCTVKSIQKIPTVGSAF